MSSSLPVPSPSVSNVLSRRRFARLRGIPLVIAAGFLLCGSLAQAQFGDFFRKAQDKITEVVDDTIGDKVDAVVEKIKGEDESVAATEAEGGETPQDTTSTAQTQTASDNQAQAAPSGATENGEAWRYAPMRGLSWVMYAYKFQPGLFDDDYLLRMVERQITMDQGLYGLSIGTTTTQPLFQRDQVEGRNAAFAARDLLPAYREKLAESAARLPTRFTHILEVVPEYDHASGKLHQPYPTDLLVDWEVAGQPLPGHETRSLHRMDSSLISGTLSALQQRFDAEFFSDPDAYGVPQSLRQNAPLPNARGSYLALDRQIVVPAFSMDSETAEHLLTAPESPFRYSAGPQRDALIREYSSFLRNVLLLVDLELEGLDVVDGAYLFKTNLLGATLLGTRGETLASYSPDDFVSLREMYEQGLTLEQQEAREEAERGRAEQLAADQENARRAAFDILGVRMGLGLAEARAALEENFVIDALYSFAPSSRQSGPPAYQPYTSGLLAVGKGGADVVAIYEREGKVIGVTRDISSSNLTEEDLLAALRGKYGEPTDNTKTTWTWGDTGQWNSCTASNNSMRNTDTTMLEDKQPVSTPPWSGEEQPKYWSNGMGVPGNASAESLTACRAVLAVYGLFGSRASRVTFRLYDHSQVADGLRQIENGRAEELIESASSLTL